MECHSVSKRNKIWTYFTTWINLKNIMFHEISQTQKDKHCMIPLTRGQNLFSRKAFLSKQKTF